MATRTEGYQLEFKMTKVVDVLEPIDKSSPIDVHGEGKLKSHPGAS